MRSVTRLAVLGLTTAALLGGSQSAKAQIGMQFDISFGGTGDPNTVSLDNGSKPAYAGELVKVTMTQTGTNSVEMLVQVTANNDPVINNMIVSNLGLNLTQSFTNPTSAFQSGSQANNLVYASNGISINGNVGSDPNSSNSTRKFTTVWDWPPPTVNGQNPGPNQYLGVAGGNQVNNSYSKYSLNFASAITDLSSLISQNGVDGYYGGVFLQRFGSNENQSVTLGVTQTTALRPVPEPASIIAGLLGLPCVGGVVSLVRRRVSGAMSA